ncbi:phosphocholine cytidylyltransferase family protein [Streptomyces sp. NPDC050619]|uniref:phosphocholine cytidylyltransferase family protein n=1 Tax=Streptomyces sp. NPDC050619 TaxID=3157214 RepID=UPI003423A618
MHAVILAAGRGSRLGALTDERPKCLVELDGRSLLDRQLDVLRQAGATEIAAVTGYRADQVAAHVPTAFQAPRWHETNMVVSLTAARDWLSSAACLVAYGDIFYTAATAERLLRTEGDELAVAYDPDWLRLWSLRFEDPLDDAESFRMTPDGRLLEIGRTPHRVEDVQGQYMGLLRFTPRSWAAVEDHLVRLDPPRRDALDMTSLLQALIETGETVRAVARTGEWGEIDSPSDLAVYQGRLAAVGQQHSDLT